jgi:indolepyruvate ferredoxin oxidoreductase
MQFPAQDIVAAIKLALGGQDPHVVDATQLATALMGDAIATNLFILGYAWQRALVPVSFDALMRAVELNGAAIEMNKTAFAWGRLAAIDLPAVLEAAGIARSIPSQDTLHELPILSPGEWEGHEWGANVAPKPNAIEDEVAPPARAWRQRCGLRAARRHAPVAFAR